MKEKCIHEQIDAFSLHEHVDAFSLHEHVDAFFLHEHVDAFSLHEHVDAFSLFLSFFDMIGRKARYLHVAYHLMTCNSFRFDG